MTTIYTTDALGVFTNILDVDPFAKLPKNCTLTPPPDTTGLEVAQLVAGAWQVLPSYPLPPAPDMVAAKAAKNTQINQWRAAANQSSFTYSGKQIACDQLSRSDIDAVANSIALTGGFPAGFPGAWKAMDNSYVAIPDVDAFKAMHAAMTLQGTVNFGHSQDLKATVAAATTIEQINAIVW